MLCAYACVLNRQLVVCRLQYLKISINSIQSREAYSIASPTPFSSAKRTRFLFALHSSPIPQAPIFCAQTPPHRSAGLAIFQYRDQHTRPHTSPLPSYSPIFALKHGQSTTAPRPSSGAIAKPASHTGPFGLFSCRHVDCRPCHRLPRPAPSAAFAAPAQARRERPQCS